ncbi:hypothetical protein CYMTET_25492, partial [Cymbomonas tetramitiformis]
MMSDAGQGAAWVARELREVRVRMMCAGVAQVMSGGAGADAFCSDEWGKGGMQGQPGWQGGGAEGDAWGRDGRVRGNRIGPEGAGKLAEALMSENCKLQHLDLRVNSIGSEGAGKLAEALMSENCKLQHLDLS